MISHCCHRFSCVTHVNFLTLFSFFWLVLHFCELFSLHSGLVSAEFASFACCSLRGLVFSGIISAKQSEIFPPPESYHCFSFFKYLLQLDICRENGVVLVHGWRCLTQHTRILVSSFSCRILSLRRSARSIFLTFYITYQKFRRKNFDGNNFGDIFGNSAEKVSAGKYFDEHFPRIFPPKFLVYSLLLIHVKNYFLEFAFWLAFHVRSA